VTNLNYDEEQ